MCQDVNNLAVPSLRWLGVLPSDIDKYVQLMLFVRYHLQLTIFTRLCSASYVS